MSMKNTTKLHKYDRRVKLHHHTFIQRDLHAFNYIGDCFINFDRTENP